VDPATTAASQATARRAAQMERRTTIAANLGTLPPRAGAAKAGKGLRRWPEKGTTAKGWRGAAEPPLQWRLALSQGSMAGDSNNEFSRTWEERWRSRGRKQPWTLVKSRRKRKSFGG